MNRTAAAVERTLPFMIACQAIAVCWYATAGHHPADVEARRLNHESRGDSDLLMIY
jgi:hypothetical protein